MARHLHGKLHQRKCALLIFDPLSSKNHRETNHNEIDCENIDRPYGERFQPCNPRDGLTRGYAFKERDNRVFISHNTPLGDILKEKPRPFVLRRRKILVRDKRGKPVSHHPGGGNTRRGNHDAPDDDEFSGGERKLWAKEPQEGIDEQCQKGEDKKRTEWKVSA